MASNVYSRSQPGCWNSLASTPTFIGCLLDVSGSMSSNIGDGVDEEGGTWARSIFQVIDDLVKHDVSGDNRIFAMGVGGEERDIFDALGTIKASRRGDGDAGDRIPASYGTIDQTFNTLENCGARTIRKWADPYTVSQAVSENQAELILKELSSNSHFTRTFVYDFLPKACRDWESGNAPGLEFWVKTTETLYSSLVSRFRKATVEDIEEVVAKSISYLTKSDFQLVDVNDDSAISVKEAATIIRGSIDVETLTNERAKELLEIVEPYIYGGTPLCKALKKACQLFSTMYPDHRRLLFVVSDGMPADTDYYDIGEISSALNRLDVTVVTCYIARESCVEPKRLHNSADHCWESGARFLFNISSTFPTQYVTRAIFLKRGWKIDISNNETRLFAHANHPDNLKDVISLARDAVCCQDSLSDLLVSVSLDVYIDEKNSTMPAHDQGDEGTCYAHAAATVLHLAMHRILGPGDGHPKFEELRDYLIDQHGRHGANTYNVLREVCPHYGLRCRKVDVNGAMKAIAEKRPVIVRFRLTDDEWETFKSFYELHPNGILQKSDLDINRRSPYEITSGHAVVLTSFNSKCLHLMNSWGDNWADMGFFRVENSDVLGLEFIDVFWVERDLLQRGNEYYHSHSSKVADQLMTSLKALQVATFTCPSCRKSPKVTEFRGTISRAKCPSCEHEFNSNDGDGNILALNMYLTSLSR